MVDLITKSLLVVKKDVILVVYNRLVYNRLSKMTYFVATTKEILVKELARLLRDNVWKLHRLQESIILDRKPQFAVKLAEKLKQSY